MNDQVYASVLPGMCTRSETNHCHCLFDQAAAVRRRLKKLGPAVSPRVLDVVRSTVSSCTDVAEALLRDIDNDTDQSETDIASTGVTIVFGETREGGGAAAQLQVCVFCCLFSQYGRDGYDILVCGLSISFYNAKCIEMFSAAFIY